MVHVFVLIQPWCHQINGSKEQPRYPHTASEEHEQKEEQEDALIIIRFCSYLNGE